MIKQMPNGHAKVAEDRDEKIGLISYLAKLGLADADLAKAISLLPTQEIEKLAELDQFDQPVEQPAAKAKTAPERFKTKPSNAKRRTIKLFMAEEQQILREAYVSFFQDEAGIELVGASDDTSAEFLVDSAQEINPDVILLGIKTVQPATVEKLQALREACPKVAVVLLFAFYDVQGLKALRTFSREPSVG